MYRKSSAGNTENWRIIKKFRKLFSVQGGAGNKKLKVWSESGDILDQTEQDVCVQSSLVSLRIDKNETYINTRNS